VVAGYLDTLLSAFIDLLFIYLLFSFPVHLWMFRKLVRLGLVFPNRGGDFLSPYLLTDGLLKRPLEGAGLPPIRFHDLRHTCATILLSRGVHAKLVQEPLGHATISITLNTYSHVLPGMDDGLAEVMAMPSGRRLRWCQKAPRDPRSLLIFPLFAGEKGVSRPGLEPGT
jgi:integrase